MVVSAAIGGAGVADSNDRAQLFQSDAAQRSNLIARMWKPRSLKGNWHYRQPVVKRLPKRSRLMLMVWHDEDEGR
ncbi:hypothetical protein ACF1BQ_029980 [Bradyrhizobium sp. RDT10]